MTVHLDGAVDDQPTEADDHAETEIDQDAPYVRPPIDPSEPIASWLAII